jgi:hypothetical protein
VNPIEFVSKHGPFAVFPELKRRNVRRLAVAGATAGMLLTLAGATLLGIFEAVAWGMKVLVRGLVLGKANAPVRGLDRSAKYDARSCHWRT